MTERDRKLTHLVPPDLPDALDPAPVELASAASWDGVAGDAEVVVPERVVDVVLREVTWTDADLSGREFVGLRARDVRFVRCDLSGAVLDEAALDRIVFDQCRLTGVVLSGSTLRDVEVRESGLRLANFRMATLERVVIESSVLEGADFYEATLTSCALVRSDLTGADFRASTVDGLDLHGSTIEDIGGALALTGVRIGADQMVPMGAAVLAALGIAVTAQEDVRPPEA